MEKKMIPGWLILFAVLAVLSGGCAVNLIIGSGRVTTENRTVSGFDGVTLAGVGDLIISQGDTEALTVEAEDNLMPYLKTEVRNGTLVISVNDGNGRTQLTPTKPLTFRLSVKNLKSIDLSGAGRISSASLRGDQLSVGVSGAGSIILDHVEAAGLAGKLSGAGSVKLAGQVTSQTVILSGLGKYDAGDLASQSAKVDVNGAGGATVRAQDSLNVTISGAGGVNYYGNPQVQKKISGLGGVNKLGD